MGKRISAEYVNFEGLTYKAWSKEVDHIIGKMCGLSLETVRDIDPEKLWKMNVTVGHMVGICTGTKDNPMDKPEVDDTYPFDDFPGYEISQVLVGEFV